MVDAEGGKGGVDLILHGEQCSVRRAGDHACTTEPVGKITLTSQHVSVGIDDRLPGWLRYRCSAARRVWFCHPDSLPRHGAAHRRDAPNRPDKGTGIRAGRAVTPGSLSVRARANTTQVHGKTATAQGIAPASGAGGRNLTQTLR